MSKLKTLKDLEVCTVSPCNRVPQIHEMGINSSTLKAEAVKWVKTEKTIFRVITQENTAESYMSPGGTALILDDNSKVTEFKLDLNLRRFLYYFFNLTEEDLK